VRIGLVGAGFMGGVHLNAYANIPEVEVVGVADANRESAAAGAGLVGARPYASYDELDLAGVGQGAGLPDQATERRGGAREKDDSAGSWMELWRVGLLRTPFWRSSHSGHSRKLRQPLSPFILGPVVQRGRADESRPYGRRLRLRGASSCWARRLGGC
jgi:hypothetical protein